MSTSATRNFWMGVLSVFLISVTITADARLIRGGGRGSAAGPVRNGFASYLLPTALVDANVTDVGGGILELAPTFDPVSTFAPYASYDFNADVQGGWPIQAHLDWGQDCEQPGQTPASTTDNPDFYDCYFELQEDEVFAFSGHTIGLPAPGTFPGNPVLDFTWVLENFVGDPLRNWDRSDSEVSEGGLLNFADSVAAGCFAVWQAYTSGFCQRYELNTGLTGAELLALSGGQGLRLSLEVSISADSGFAFYNYTDASQPGDPFRFLELGGSISGQDSGGLRLDEASAKMRIEVVPVPATYMLLTIGLAGLLRRARRAQRII